LANDIAIIKEVAVRLRNSVSEIIVGKGSSIDLTVIAVLCRGHILVEDVPGVGKTTLAKALSGAMDCSFGRIQFTPDLMPSDVLGINWFNQKTDVFEFRPGPIFSGVVLADEINRATPRTQSALLEAMQEGQVTIDGETHSLPFPFIVIATQNPIDMEGTFPLPEAQLDRFMVRISLGYPTIEQEEDVVLRYQSGGELPSQEVEVDSNQLRLMQQAVSEVRVENSIRRYIVDLVRATRVSERTKLGASPRASISLYRASQARAGLLGRDYVIPDDVKILSQPVLSHRIIPTANARLRGYSQNSIVEEILSSIPVPIEKD
jgi:MoxR-like ATPase